MSGIPGMGQHWQAVLKIRMIMIPLPKTWQPEQRPGCATAGKGAAGHYAPAVACGNCFFCGRGISDTDSGERKTIYINFAVLECKAGRYYSRETSDKECISGRIRYIGE